MPAAPIVVADYACQTGENPLWHPTEHKLYWTDIPTGKLFWYDPKTGEHTCFYEDRPVGGFTFQADGAMLAFRDKGNVVVMRDGRVVDTVIEQLDGETASRFNDVMADPRGGVFCGTMPTPDRKGRLYYLDTDGSVRVLLEGIGCSNGMGFSPDNRTLYYTDSPAKSIYAFDFDPETSVIDRQRVFIDTTDVHGGVPDGMTTDARGHLYSATWGDSAVIHYDEAGRFVERFELPTPHITSLVLAPDVASGGEALTAAYVTSAMGQKKDELGEAAGALFRLDLGTTGRPEYPSRVGLG